MIETRGNNFLPQTALSPSLAFWGNKSGSDKMIGPFKHWGQTDCGLLKQRKALTRSGEEEDAKEDYIQVWAGRQKGQRTCKNAGLPLLVSLFVVSRVFFLVCLFSAAPISLEVYFTLPSVYFVPLSLGLNPPTYTHILYSGDPNCGRVVGASVALVAFFAGRAAVRAHHCEVYLRVLSKSQEKYLSENLYYHLWI